MPEGIMETFSSSVTEFFNQLVPVYVIPNIQIIIQIITLLIIGYVAGRVAKIAVVKILNIVGFRRITSKTWPESVLKITGYKGNIVGLLGDLVKWLVYILFFSAIIQLIGLPGLAEWFKQIAIFLPRFIGSIIVVVIGFIVADFFGKVFEEVIRKYLFENVVAEIFGMLAKYMVALVSVIMALALIGIDTLSLTLMFMIILTTLMIVVIIGIRDIFPNFTAGLQLRKDLKTGRFIKSGEFSGIIEEIRPLSVMLKDGSRRIIIPNSLLLSRVYETKEK